MTTITGISAGGTGGGSEVGQDPILYNKTSDDGQRFYAIELSPEVGRDGTRYFPKINGKPVRCLVGEELYYIDSHSLEFCWTKRNEVIEIIEMGNKGTNSSMYVEVQSENEHSFSVLEACPDQNFSLQRARLKCDRLPPSFIPYKIFYNRHGLAVLGWEGKDPVFFYAAPDQELKKKTSASITVSEDKSSWRVDAGWTFCSIHGEKLQLNKEDALQIVDFE